METGSPSPPGGSPVLPSYLDRVEVDGNKFDIPFEIFFCTILDPREGDTRAKFKLDQTLITPYGNFAR